MMKKVLFAAGLAALVGCSDEEASVTDPMSAAGVPGTEAAVPGAIGSQQQVANVPVTGQPLTPEQESQVIQQNLQAQQQGVVYTQGQYKQLPATKLEDYNASLFQNMPIAKPGEQRFVKVHSLNIRSAPGLSHKVVGVLPFNAQIGVIEQVNKAWIKIGPNKYVGTRYLSGQSNQFVTIPNKQKIYAH